MVKIKPYKNQDYQLLQEQHSSTRLFTDPEFLACIKSISHSGKLVVGEDAENSILNLLEWRRPCELFTKPRFVIDGYQRRDISQGAVNNCWFIASAGLLTLDQDLLAFVIPNNQTFDRSEYTGMFHFRFWLFGEWNDVVIDDRLPCYRGKFVFCQNPKEPEELWAALLEKAYAKVCGSYEALSWGRTCDGLVDFTGGIDEMVCLRTDKPAETFKSEIKRVITEACAKKSMMGCSIIPKSEVTVGLLDNGLAAGHAFSVTQIKEIKTPTGMVSLVRCLNPWSNSVEWNGDWSDQSPLWDSVSAEERRKFKFHKSDDGEFWMSYDDFFNNFDVLQLCHCRPDSLSSWAEGISTSEPSSVKDMPWNEVVFHGEWKANESAGGPGHGDEPREKYWLNPQYLVQFQANDSETGEDKRYTLIISLMSKQERKTYCNNDSAQLSIGYDLYSVKDGVDVRGHIDNGQKLYMTDLTEAADSEYYKMWRSVTIRFRVQPGAYVIIPSTEKYNDEGQFLLRLFTDQPNGHTVTAELKVNKENLTEDDMHRPSLETEKEKEEVGQIDEEKGAASTNTKEEAIFSLKSSEAMAKADVKSKENTCTIQ